MADIELVIKLPEEDFERCKKRFQRRIDIMGDAIAKGVPLPKGHGRLIDEDDLMAKMVDFCVVYDEIMETPTIIEAESDGERND